MGSHNSTQKWQNIIEINIQKNCFYPIETIEGEIRLTLDKPLLLTDIVVSLQFNEVWKVQRGKCHYQNIIDTTLKSTKLNIPQMLKISDPSITLAPGNYSFPFQFKIPSDVQPTFIWRYYTYQLYSTYFILAEILNPIKPMTIKHFIFIKSNPPELNQLFLSTTTDVAKGKNNKGKTTISGKIPYNNYLYNDIIPFEVTIDNSKGELKVKECQIKLIRKMVFLYENGTKNLFAKNVFYSHVHPFICNIGEEKTESFQIPIQFVKWKTQTETLKPYPSPIIQTEFWSSYKSTTFVIHYIIKATAFFESSVDKKSRPKIVFPIILCHQTNHDKMISKEKNEC